MTAARLQVVEIMHYQCPVCRQVFTTREAAEKCLARPWRPEFVPGDVVVYRPALGIDYDDRPCEPHCRFTWGDVHKEWMFLDLPHAGLHQKRGFEPYYVVGAVTAREDHEPAYHLFTGVFGEEQKWWNEGWTSPRTHYRFAKAPDPPAAIVKAGKKFIGRMTIRLM